MPPTESEEDLPCSSLCGPGGLGGSAGLLVAGAKSPGAGIGVRFQMGPLAALVLL